MFNFIKSFASKYLVKGLIVVVLALLATNGYQYLQLNNLKNTNENLRSANTLLLTTNETNVKAIEDLQTDKTYNEKLISEQVVRLSELKNKTCTTILEIQKIKTSEKKENVNEDDETCDIDSNIPDELISLFKSSGY